MPPDTANIATDPEEARELDERYQRLRNVIAHTGVDYCVVGAVIGAFLGSTLLGLVIALLGVLVTFAALHHFAGQRRARLAAWVDPTTGGIAVPGTPEVGLRAVIFHAVVAAVGVGALLAVMNS